VLEESKDDIKYAQGQQRKLMSLISDHLQQRKQLVARINSPIRPIMNLVANIERSENRIEQLRLKLSAYKATATTASSKSESDSKIAEDLHAAETKDEDALMKADKAAKESLERVKESNKMLLQCLLNISDAVQQLNSTQKQVNDITFETLGKLRRNEQITERKMIETSRKLKNLNSYVKSGKYEMNKAKVNLANAKRSGNTNEAQKQADLVESLADKVGERVDKEKVAEDLAKNA